MRWLMFFATLSACGYNPPCRKLAKVGPSYTSLALPGVVTQLAVPQRVGCSDTKITASASVLDPGGDAIEAAVVTQPTRDGSDVVTAIVEFTPRVPGTYHVVARFEPSFGIAQDDVDVAVDLRDAPATLELDAQQFGSCIHVDVLPSGRPFCVDWPSARAGPVVWLSDGGGVSRWVDRDGGLEREPDDSISLAVTLLLPGLDDAVALDSAGRMTRVTIADGGLTARASPSDAGPMPGMTWIAWRSGNETVTLWGRSWPLLGLGPGGIIRRAEQDFSFEHIAPQPYALEAHRAFHDALPFHPRLLEWDTGALLDRPDGGKVAISYEAGHYSFADYGDVTSATTEWVTVRRAGKLLLLKR